MAKQPRDFMVGGSLFASTEEEGDGSRSIILWSNMAYLMRLRGTRVIGRFTRWMVKADAWCREAKP